MKTTFVVSRKQLPTRPPTLLTLYLLLAADFYGWSDLVRGITYTVLVIVWVGFFSLFFSQDEKELTELKSKWGPGRE